MHRHLVGMAQEPGRCLLLALGAGNHRNRHMGVWPMSKKTINSFRFLYDASTDSVICRFYTGGHEFFDADVNTMCLGNAVADGAKILQSILQIKMTGAAAA